MNLKERNSTKACIIFYEVSDLSVQDLMAEYKKQGYFYPPWHVYIDEEGQLTEGRPVDVVAGSEYPNNEEIFAIVVNSPDDISINGRQEEALARIVVKVFQEYPDIERMDIHVNSDLTTPAMSRLR